MKESTRQKIKDWWDTTLAFWPLWLVMSVVLLCATMESLSDREMGITCNGDKYIKLGDGKINCCHEEARMSNNQWVKEETCRAATQEDISKGLFENE